MADEFDLQIVNGDLVFGDDGDPVFLSGVDVVAQDLAHRLRESGLAADLVGDDSPVAIVRVAIKTEIEKDLRIDPGSVAMTEVSPGIWDITALTVENAAVSITLGQT